MPLDNDSIVNVGSIGSGQGFRVLCLTNATDCCSDAQGNATGTWRFPNGTNLPFFADVRGVTNFSRSRGQSVVHLHRFLGPPERGRFRCDLLGDTIYVNICE